MNLRELSANEVMNYTRVYKKLEAVFFHMVYRTIKLLGIVSHLSSGNSWKTMSCDIGFPVPIECMVKQYDPREQYTVCRNMCYVHVAREC